VKEAMPKLESDSPVDAAEARFRLLGIVEERVADRCARHDQTLAKTLNGLFEAQKEVVRRIRESSSLLVPSGSKEAPAAKEEGSEGSAASEKEDVKAALQEALSGSTSMVEPRTMKTPVAPTMTKVASGSTMTKVASGPTMTKVASMPLLSDTSSRLSGGALSMSAGGISAFASAARLTAQPGGRELLASQVSPMWDDDDDDDEWNAKRRTQEIVVDTQETKRSHQMLASLPRHLRHSWQPTSYTKIHMDSSKGRKKSEHSRPQQELKLRQLRDIMNLVYQSKHQADDECVENNEPKDTMSNYLFSYLRSKYGSRTAVEEWYHVIKKGIDKYSRRDPEIDVFGKILQNELPESFPLVQEQLSKSVLSILRRNLEESNENLSASEISVIWNAWDRQGVPLEAINEVVRFMYSSQDRQDILEELRELSEKPQPAGLMEVAVKKDCIRLNRFLQVLKSFQLELADKYLVDFIRMFREVDVNGNGTINGHQLQDLVRRTAHLPQAMHGTHAANVVDEERVAATAAIKNVRACTFSETVDLCKDLITARERAKQQM